MVTPEQQTKYETKRKEMEDWAKRIAKGISDTWLDVLHRAAQDEQIFRSMPVCKMCDYRFCICAENEEAYED